MLVAGCDGCEGCDCGAGPDPARDEVGAAVPTPTGEDQTLTPPPDRLAGLELPVSRSAQPMSDRGPILTVSTHAIELDGRPLASLSDGEFPAGAGRDALAEACGEALMSLVEGQDTPVRVAADRRVTFEVLEVLFETVWAIDAPIELVAQSPGGEPVGVQISKPDQDRHARRSGRRRQPRQEPSPNPERSGPRTATADGTGAPRPGLADRFVVQVSVHDAGIWLMAGSVPDPLLGFRGIEARSERHPNHRAESAWSRGRAVDTWLDWAHLGAELTRARLAGEPLETALTARILIEDHMTYELLIRVLDVVAIEGGFSQPQLVLGS